MTRGQFLLEITWLPSDCSNILKVSTTAGTLWYFLILANITHPLPSPMEHMSPNKHHPLSPFVWVRNRHQKAVYKQRQAQNQSRTLWALWPKKRKEMNSFRFRYNRLVIVQSLGRVQIFATQWTEAHLPSLSFMISWSLLKLTSIESMMLSNHLILCHPLLLLP